MGTDALLPPPPLATTLTRHALITHHTGDYSEAGCAATEAANSMGRHLAHLVRAWAGWHDASDDEVQRAINAFARDVRVRLRDIGGVLVVCTAVSFPNTVPAPSSK